MRTETADRERAALLSDLGPIIGQALQDPAVVEVMAAADRRALPGRLHAARPGAGLRHPQTTGSS
jgi:hypothetical protein